MRRRKRIFKLPFIRTRRNKKTIFNMIGFLFVGLSLVLGVSFFKSFTTSNNGQFLSIINDELVVKFGPISILIPLVVLLFSAHFFNSKKLKFIKFNITGGLVLIFISLLGFFRSGYFGVLIYDNLLQDFSFIGAIVILTVIFVIGLIFFLDTSVDVFVLFIINIFKKLYEFFKQYIFRSFFDKDWKKSKKPETEKESQQFIEDKTLDDKIKSKPSYIQASSTLPSHGIAIKPLSKASQSAWVYPPLTLLAETNQKIAQRGDIKKNASIIEQTLDSFGIRARVVDINKGPTITQYALEIAKGTKLSRITALSNDLALAIAAQTGAVRIEAPIPGRSLVGIEIPNIKPEIVTLKRLLSSPLFTNNSDPLFVPLGLGVSGEPEAASISKMPHVLIAGTTGSGKSILLNSWICTFLLRTKPEQLRLILIDPKRVELTLYNGIPHLLTEVIVDPQKIVSALRWTVSEMEIRYKEFSAKRVRNLEGYNALKDVEKKPYIMFIIDELADLMVFAKGEAEELITRVAQMARATGIHLILATQRPSVDVITGLMKANIPARLAFNVNSMIDSRVIIDMPGAEKLLGKGDMLFLPPEQAKPRRYQGPYITEKEVINLVQFLKSQVPEVHYTEEVTQQESGISMTKRGTMIIDGMQRDPKFNDALNVIMQEGKGSASLIQRRLSVGYARAARILDQLTSQGYLGPAQGSKPREILKRPVIEEVSEMSIE